MSSADPARAWKCPLCTRLTIRLEHERPPVKCDHCPGAVEPFPLQRPRRNW